MTSAHETMTSAHQTQTPFLFFSRTLPAYSSTRAFEDNCKSKSEVIRSPLSPHIARFSRWKELGSGRSRKKNSWSPQTSFTLGSSTKTIPDHSFAPFQDDGSIVLLTSQRQFLSLENLSGTRNGLVESFGKESFIGKHAGEADQTLNSTLSDNCFEAESLELDERTSGTDDSHKLEMENRILYELSRRRGFSRHPLMTSWTPETTSQNTLINSTPDSRGYCSTPRSSAWLTPHTSRRRSFQHYLRGGCAVCGFTVSTPDRVINNDVVYHRNCFKCIKCTV